MLETNIARLISGRIPCATYYIGVLTPLQLLFVGQAYDKALELAGFEGLLQEEELVKYLTLCDLWSQAQQDELDSLPHKIEHLKIQLYEARTNPPQSDLIRKQLNRDKARFFSLLAQRHKYDEITAEGHANFVRSVYYIGYGARNSRDEPVWQDESFLGDDNILINLLQEFCYLAESEIRSIARSDLWRSWWCLYETSVFADKFLNDEQRILANWSKIYDATRDSPECPSDEVINDDDVFDGFLLAQKRKRTEEEKPQNKFGNANEVFIPAGPDQIQKINALNNTTAKILKRQRLDLVQQKGQVKETEFPDARREMAQQAMQQFRDHIKRS